MEIKCKMNKIILTNETDIYTFFEIIDKSEAGSILDVGMFLKRIGSVSRQVKEKEIPRDRILTGVDYFEEIQCPVWNNIYDEIYRPEEIFISENNQRYELATVLQLHEYIEEEKYFEMWEWLCGHVSYVLTDYNIDKVKKMIKYMTVLPVTVDDKSYWFITL